MNLSRSIEFECQDTILTITIEESKLDFFDEDDNSICISYYFVKIKFINTSNNDIIEKTIDKMKVYYGDEDCIFRYNDIINLILSTNLDEFKSNPIIQIVTSLKIYENKYYLHIDFVYNNNIINFDFCACDNENHSSEIKQQFLIECKKKFIEELRVGYNILDGLLHTANPEFYLLNGVEI